MARDTVRLAVMAVALALTAALALAAAACGNRKEAAPAASAGPAGVVVHSMGSVTAARPGEAARPLAVDGAVSADDTVTTGPDGEVSIVLQHNKVRWDIGSGQSIRVDASRAWSSAGEGSGSALDDRGDLTTAAAGRHSEREAGETQGTAVSNAEPVAPGVAPPAPGAAPSAPGAAPPAPGASDRSLERAGASDDRHASAAREEPSAESGLLGSGAGGAASASVGGGARGNSTGSIAPGDTASAGAMRMTPSAPATTRVTQGALKVRGPRRAGDVEKMLASLGAEKCSATATGTALLHFEVGGDGVVRKARVTGPAALVAQAKSCLVAAAGALRFAASEGATAVTYVDREIRFTAP